MESKISITFAVMKGLRKVLIKSFLLLALSLVVGINSYSYYNLSYINNELVTCTSNVEDSISPHFDTINDDQIDQSDNSDLSPTQLSSIPIRQRNSPLHIFYLSVWQPPKIS
jgi:hypothetical protein